MKRTAQLFSLIFLLLAYFPSAKASPFGISYSQVILAKDPPNLHGLRAAVVYQPESLIWNQVQIYFDASYGYWWVNSQRHHSLNSFAIAPYVRYWLAKKPIFSPFVQFSIAPAYISRTRIHTRNLGMHFIFQDQVSAGAAFGNKRNFYTIVSLVHYSNGSLCDQNQGVTAPLTLTFGYQF